MVAEEYREEPEERKLHKATSRALEKYREACKPAWDRLQKALRAAWRQYDKEVVGFQKTCDREIARASRVYTKATQNSGKGDKA